MNFEDYMRMLGKVMEYNFVISIIDFIRANKTYGAYISCGM